MEQVMCRGFTSKEQAESAKRSKEYKGLVLEVRPDDLNMGRYMLIAIVDKLIVSKHYRGEGWSSPMPFGVQVTAFLKGRIWDYCQWDSDSEKNFLTYFIEGKSIGVYNRADKTFSCPPQNNMV